MICGLLQKRLERFLIIKERAKMNIWFFHHYATPLTMSGMQRPELFAKQLRLRGHRVAVFASSYLHYSGENVITDKNLYKIVWEDQIPFIFVRTTGYTDSMRRRVMNMGQYALHVQKVARIYAQKNGPPDIIIASSPHPLAMVAGLRTAKKWGASCICEVRDFWPEVLFLSGKLRSQSAIGRALTLAEHRIYRDADAIVFLKEGDQTYLAEHYWDDSHGGDVKTEKCFYINNGVDLKQYDSDFHRYVLTDPDLTDSAYRIVYAGAIRPVNQVENLLDCAKILARNYPDIRFLVYGDGSERAKLEQRIAQESIKNVVLKGRIQRQYLPYVLRCSRLNVLHYTSEHYNWSRGNSSNKLFEYMASGRPIVSNIKTGYDLIDRYRCGISMADSSAQSLASAIAQIHDMPECEYRQMCKNALTAAGDFDYSCLTDQLEAVLQYCTEKRRKAGYDGG